MKPFRLSADEALQHKKDLKLKDQIVEKHTAEFVSVIKSGIDQVANHYIKTGSYKEPDLDQMDAIFKSFYTQVVIAAVKSTMQLTPKKRLAKDDLPAGDLPDDLSKILKRNPSYWRRIYKRARAVTGRAKKQYLERLREQFKKIAPILDQGQMAPREIKKKIAEAWKAPKARTETIFRTETTKYFAEAQIEYTKDSTLILGYLYDSVRDTSRTPICKCRHGMVIPFGDEKLLRENTPPLHFSCRSALIPLVDIPMNREMLADKDRKPSSRPLKQKKYKPLPGFGE